MVRKEEQSVHNRIPGGNTAPRRIRSFAGRNQRACDRDANPPVDIVEGNQSLHDRHCPVPSECRNKGMIWARKASRDPRRAEHGPCSGRNALAYVGAKGSVTSSGGARAFQAPAADTVLMSLIILKNHCVPDVRWWAENVRLCRPLVAFLDELRGTGLDVHS
jgi:hypothetical protein